MVKSPTWQLARIYIYTLPFANLDMILENCLFARVCGCFGEIDDFCQKQKYLSDHFGAINKMMSDIYSKN
jgi:hypothetical protein